MTVHKLIAVSILMAAPFVASGQWVSVSATKTTRREETAPNGKMLQDTTSTGRYYRSTDGSVATVTTQAGPNGELQFKTGRLLDNNGLAVYSIDYQNKIAYRERVLSQPRQFQDGPAIYAQVHDHATVDGISCVVLPILENGKPIGKVWKSPKYDLVVKMDFTLDNSGEKTHVTTQLSSIHLNANIPATIFQLPANFTVMDTPPKIPKHPGTMSMFP